MPFFRVPHCYETGPGLLLLALALAGCEKQAATGPVLVYTGPLMETSNVRTLMSDSAKLKLELTAPLEQLFDNSDKVYPQGAKVIFYSADGRKTVINTLTAKYAKFEKGKNLYTMRGDVQATNVPEQQRLHTEEMFYDQAKQVIYTDTAMFVKVETPTEYIDGYGLTANQNFSRYSIKRPTGILAKTGAGL